MLYRVIVKETSSLQPGSGVTFWNKRCIYCGYDKQEARRAFWSEECGDYWQGYGGSCRSTKFQEIAEADSVDDERAVSVEVSDE